MRFTHRRCRTELQEALEAADRQTNRVTDLEARLREEEMAHQYLVDEIRDACQDLEYAEEAVIPDYLREQLLDAHDRQFVLAEHTRALEQLDRITQEHTEQIERALRTAHEEGRLARTWVLLAGAGMSWQVSADLADLLRATRIITWTDEHRWACPTPGCVRPGQALVWHTDHQHQAHLACPCGQVWAAPASEVERTEGEIERRPWGATPDPTSLQQRPAHVLDAFDRALPTPAQVRDREAVPA